MRRALAFAAVLLAVPAPHRAGDDERSWDDAPGGAADEPAPGDVSVGLEAGAGPSGGAVTVETFREPLAPYGQWVSVPPYGPVWRPIGVPGGWRPYAYGRWEWTDEGWLWVSDEPFGWATYHYGRWAYHPNAGWIWIPGTQWAPAWVTWRYGPDFIGWAPLAPGFSVYVSSYPIVYSWWTFVPCGFFVGAPVQRYAYAPSYVPRLVATTQPAPPRTAAYGHPAPAWGGPPRRFVEQRSGRAVVPVRVQPVGSARAAIAPPHGAAVPVFRPEARPLPSRPAPAAGRPQREAWSSPGRAPSAPRRAGPPGWAPAAPRPTPGASPAQGGGPVPRAGPPAGAPREASHPRAAPQAPPRREGHGGGHPGNGERR